MVRGSMGQTGPMAATFDLDAVGDGTGVVGVVLLVGDGTLVVVALLPVGDEGVAADLGPAAVVVKRPGVCDWLVLCVHAATPRTKRAGARTMIMRRLRELFMTVPLRCIRSPGWTPPISLSPRGAPGRSHPRCGVRPPHQGLRLRHLHQHRQERRYEQPPPDPAMHDRSCRQRKAGPRSSQADPHTDRGLARIRPGSFPLRDVGTFVPGAAREAVWND
jgi:hypothetical protein